MPDFITVPYRLRRRLVREACLRCRGWDAKLDRFLYKAFARNREAKKFFLSLSQYVPWLGDRSLSFASELEKEKIVKIADQTCSHVFDLLGSGPVHLGDEINWHLDFKSGHQWDRNIYYKCHKWASLPRGVDIKVPWELSRCLHFSSLGMADWITGDPKYYREFKAQVRHWISSNPYTYGVNWACAMDVAIRAVNWINALMLFQHRIEEDTDESFYEELVEALWLAGVHINRNLEWNGPKSTGAGNHFISDITGLFALGLVFRKKRVGTQWLKRSRTWFEREITKQVHEDGANYESSTYYHRLVLEMFLWVNTLADRAGEPFSDSYKERLCKMGGFTAAYTSPSGRAMQIGDNDSGRLLRAGVGSASDHRYLLDGCVGEGGGVDRFLLVGDQANALPVSCAEEAYPDGGLYFLAQGDVWLGVRAGQVLHRGGHAHCDQLAVVFSAKGRDFIVDRGTGIYTPDSEMRNEFRATACHNTIQINDWEQCQFERDRCRVFQMANDTRTVVEEYNRTSESSIFIGSHTGFSRLRADVRCRRSLSLSADELIITDEVTGLKSGDEVVMRYHLDPEVDVQISKNRARLTNGEETVSVHWTDELQGTVDNVRHSKAYGQWEDAQVLKFSTTLRHAGDIRVTVKFLWA